MLFLSTLLNSILFYRRPKFLLFFFGAAITLSLLDETEAFPLPWPERPAYQHIPRPPQPPPTPPAAPASQPFSKTGVRRMRLPIAGGQRPREGRNAPQRACVPCGRLTGPG